MELKPIELLCREFDKGEWQAIQEYLEHPPSTNPVFYWQIHDNRAREFIIALATLIPDSNPPIDTIKKLMPPYEGWGPDEELKRRHITFAMRVSETTGLPIIYNPNKGVTLVLTRPIATKLTALKKAHDAEIDQQNAALSNGTGTLSEREQGILTDWGQHLLLDANIANSGMLEKAGVISPLRGLPQEDAFRQIILNETARAIGTILALRDHELTNQLSSPRSLSQNFKIGVEKPVHTLVATRLKMTIAKPDKDKPIDFIMEAHGKTDILKSAIEKYISEIMPLVIEEIKSHMRERHK